MPSIPQEDTQEPGLTRRSPLGSALCRHKNPKSQNKPLLEWKYFLHTPHPVPAPLWKSWQPPPACFPQNFPWHFQSKPQPHLSFPHSAYQNTSFSHCSGSGIPLHIPASPPESIYEKEWSDFPGKLHRNFHYSKIFHNCCGQVPAQRLQDWQPPSGSGFRL